MADVFMVRLPGGQQYGPADAATLRSWYAEGRIRSDAVLLAPGASEWRGIGEVFDVSGWSTPTAPAPPVAPAPSARPAAPRRPAPRPPKRGGPPLVWLAAAGALALLLGLGLVVLAVRFLSPGPQGREGEIRALDSKARTYADAALGVSLRVPSGWILVAPESPLEFAPDAKVRLAEPALAGFAFLRTDSIPTGVPSLDLYLDRVFEGRRRTFPDLKDLGRADVPSLRGRRMMSSWTAAGQKLRGAATVWQDGWDYFELEGWVPAAAAEPFEQEYESLEKAFTLQGVLGARIEAAATQILGLAPHLSRASAEMLARDGLSRGLSPEAIAEKSFQVASRGFVALNPGDLKEMAEIFKLVYAPLSDQDRARLAAYLARVKGGKAQAEDDAEMRETMKSGILGLPDESRARLQAIFDKAIAAGLVVSP